jgi:hypothetical protein
LAHVPHEALLRDVWQAKLRSFELMRCFRPDLPALESCLADIRTLAPEKGARESADVLRLEGLLHRARGQHEEALERFERAWNYPTGSGFHPYLIAYGALFSTLVLGEQSAFQLWSEALGYMGQHSLEAQAAWLEIQARRELGDNQGEQAASMVRDLEQLVAKTQQPIWQRRVVMLQVRTWLLDPMKGDPMSLEHPMWLSLAKRISGVPEAFDRYDRVMLVVDARIAALRFAVGVQPVDDLYYRNSQRLDGLPDEPTGGLVEIERRRQACYRAVKKANAVARTLDKAFDCMWRQEEVAGRLLRIKELLQPTS